MEEINWTNVLILLAMLYVSVVLVSGIIRYVVIGAIVLFVAIGVFHTIEEMGGLP